MQNQSVFFYLLLITILAVMVPVLFSRIQRFRIPIVIGEIIVGIIIGKSGFDLVGPNQIVEFLAEFGFVFLMFTSGLEVDINFFLLANITGVQKPIWRRPLLIVILGFMLTLAGAFLTAHWLSLKGFVSNPIIIGLILSTTSLGIVVPVLKERGILTTAYGQLMLFSAIVGDFITLVLLSLVFGIIKKGFVLELFLFLLLLAIFGMTIRLGLLTKRMPSVQKIIKELSSATAQIRIRGSIALMVAWVVLAKAIGTEIILGAFLAGIIVNIIFIGDTEEQVFKEKLDGLGYGFFIPIFFITVGSKFDAGALFGSGKALLLFPLLIGAAYVVKLIPTMVYKFAFSWKESVAAGFLLSSRLSLIIAASALALQLGVISDAVNANFILVAITTCILSPVLFNRLLPYIHGAQRKGIIIVGLNQLTAHLADRLHHDGEEISVLGCPEDRRNEPYCWGIAPTFGEPGDQEVLEAVGAKRAAALVSVLDDPEANIALCRIAKEVFNIPIVVTRADNPSVMEQLQALGVRVVQPALATAIALEGALLFPAAFDVLSGHRENVEIMEATVRNRRFDGLAMSKIRLPGNALVMGLRRKGEVIVPHGQTTFRMNDIVMLVGNLDAIRDAKNIMEGGS